MPPTRTHCKLFHCFQGIQLPTLFFCWNGFILHVFLPGSGGVVSAQASSVCYRFRQKGELWGQEQHSHSGNLMSWGNERSKHVLQEQGRERAEAMRGCSAAELCGRGGDWPLWSCNRRDTSMSPTDSTRALTFHPTNPRSYLPSPPTAWPHPAIWPCMISSAGRGMPWERQCQDAHTQTHTRTHIRLQPSASSAPLHALSFVSSAFFLKPC